MIEAALQFPDLNPVALSIGPLHVGAWTLGPLQLRWYALAYIAGLFLGWRYMLHLMNTRRLWGPGQPRFTPADADDFLFWAILGVLIGGRLGSVIFYMLPDPVSRARLVEDPLAIFRLWEGGMSFHGGLIGVALAIVHVARKKSADGKSIGVLALGDLAATAAPIGLFLGRIANFVNGELWGRPTDAPWGMVFPNAGAAARHPSQLYEACLEGLVLFVVLRLATHRFDVLKRPGLATGLFLFGYGLARVSLEQVREPDAQMPEALRGYVTMGLLLSVPMIAAGAWLIARAVKKPAPVAAT